MPTIMLAVNLSARQFHDNKLPQLVSDLAKATGVGLGENNLELEITETLLMKDVVATREMLLRLHDMGIKIAIDDFGTGYSALSYLIKFPLNYLKIDKSFVDRIHVSNDAKAIVEAIVSLSNALRLTVIGEGVETKEQLNVLISLGCRQFQGYLFAKPMPEEDFVQIMLEDSGVSIVSSMLDDNLFGDTVLKSNHHNSSQTKH
jgi:EAL domain-containing protein (putative c-di-GMP-specific phosphodiesterase class I)